MRVLVAVASYGTGNDAYLRQLVNEYRSMPHDVDIVVLSNLAKELGPGVEVVVGLPSKNPRSLPFAHKRFFAERLNNYDLFVYSEDDILITEKNIQAFLRASDVLPEDEIAGFLRYEVNQDGGIYLSDALGFFHWDPDSVRARGDQTYAFFTNEHAACYILTRPQLQRAIASGGFLVAPYEGKYDMLCTAATDPYTQCGFKKLICISHLDEFLVHHLSNKYIGKYSLPRADFRTQIEALLKTADNGSSQTLFETETRLPRLIYSKVFYEPVREDVVSLIPGGVRSVLSIGCGWGAMEEYLAKRGLRVAAVPMDPVIGACAEARGVRTVYGDLDSVPKKIANERFDCLLMSNVLHLVADPLNVLSSFAPLLSDDSTVIAMVPNLSRAPVLWGRIRGDRRFKDLGRYNKTRVNLTSHKILRNWFESAGMRIERVIDVFPESVRGVGRLTLGLVAQWLSSEIVVVARTNLNRHH